MTGCVDQTGNHMYPSDDSRFQISLRHRREREALVGYMAGKWQSHTDPSEDAKRPLSHAARNCKNSNQQYETIETNRIRTLITCVSELHL